MNLYTTTTTTTTTICSDGGTLRVAVNVVTAKIYSMTMTMTVTMPMNAGVPHYPSRWGIQHTEAEEGGADSLP